MAVLKFKIEIEMVPKADEYFDRITQAERFWSRVRSARGTSNGGQRSPAEEAQRFRVRLAKSIEARIVQELNRRVNDLLDESFRREVDRRIQSEVDYMNAILERAYADWFSTDQQREALANRLSARVAGKQVRARVGSVQYGSLKSPVEILGFEPLAKVFGEGSEAFESFLELCIADAIPEALDVLPDEAEIGVVSQPENSHVITEVVKAEDAQPEKKGREIAGPAGATWEKIKSAAYFPVILALVVGAYVVKSYSDIEASRRDWMKAMTDQQNRVFEFQQKQTIDLLQEYRNLLQEKRGAYDPQKAKKP